MDKNHTCSHANGGGNHFLLGLIIGAILVLLFTTQRGRRLLKELSENGLDAIADLKDLSHLDDLVSDEGEEEPVERAPSTPRKRFFRGIKRR